jgi:protein-L-isoaspartate(D-aspartate) O-methyltransferase
MTPGTASFDFDKARFNMIEQQIRPWEVLDANVLALLNQVKREQFAPAAYRTVALVDMELPLTTPAQDGQCMLAPKVEARAVQELALQAHETVLEIGAGSGHMAAMMAQLCAKVVTVEIDGALAQQAQENLRAAGVSNVEVRHADATAQRYAACQQGAPFDAIVLSGSVAEVPGALLDLLKDGGRLFAIVGDEPVMRATLVRRVGPTSFHTIQPWDISTARLKNFPEPSTFRF